MHGPFADGEGLSHQMIIPIIGCTRKAPEGYATSPCPVALGRAERGSVPPLLAYLLVPVRLTQGLRALTLFLDQSQSSEQPVRI